MAINVFGAGAVQSAYVSYSPIDLTANSVTLLWPTSYVDAPYIDPVTNVRYEILAASMHVTTVSPNVHTIKLPDATQSSVGQNFIITNIGAASFSLLYSDGTTFMPVATGLSYWIQLTDNTTPNGVWKNVQFGAGNSQAIATDLAGNGLVVLPAENKLNTGTLITPENANTALNATHRAKLILWTGAEGTLTLPTTPGVVPAGYYVSFNNAGTAQLTIQAGGGKNIDGQSEIAVQKRQSLTIISDGVNWWSLGFGQNPKLHQLTPSLIIVKDWRWSQLVELRIRSESICSNVILDQTRWWGC